MTDDSRPFAPPPGMKGLADLGKERGFLQRYGAYSAGRGRLISAPFAPLNTSRQRGNGIDAGAASISLMVIIHGLFAGGAILSGDVRTLAIHGGLTLLALLTAWAILTGPSRWPAWFAVGWLLFELFLARRLLGYQWGQTILHVIVLPPAILGIRATHRRASLLAASQAP